MYAHRLTLSLFSRILGGEGREGSRLQCPKGVAAIKKVARTMREKRWNPSTVEEKELNLQGAGMEEKDESKSERKEVQQPSVSPNGSPCLVIHQTAGIN